MKIENQVCSLELSKKLKEAGYKQEGLWWYRILAHAYNGYRIILKEPEAKEDYKFVAPTVAEGLEKLPPVIEKDELTYTLRMMKIKQDKYCVQYHNPDCVLGQNIFSYNLVNAVHEMWLYLKKEGLLKKENK